MNLVKVDEPTGLELWSDKEERHFELRRAGKLLSTYNLRKSEAIHKFNREVENATPNSR